MTPDINSFGEFLAYWAPGGLIGARHMAGLAYDHGQKSLENFNKGRRGYDDVCPNPEGRAFFAFFGGFLAWPVIYGGWIAKTAIERTPQKTWDVLQWIVLKPPPRKVRKQRELEKSREKTKQLEKDLNL